MEPIHEDEFVTRRMQDDWRDRFTDVVLHDAIETGNLDQAEKRAKKIKRRTEHSEAWAAGIFLISLKRYRGTARLLSQLNARAEQHLHDRNVDD